MTYGTIIFDEILVVAISRIRLQRGEIQIGGDVVWGDISPAAQAACARECDHHVYGSDGTLIYVGVNPPLVTEKMDLASDDTLGVTLWVTAADDKRTTQWRRAHA